jgi:hypothetical protein
MLNLKGVANLHQILERLAAGAGLLSFPQMEIKESNSRAMVVCLQYLVVQLQEQKAGPLVWGEQLVLMAEAAQWVQGFPNLEC